MSSVEAGAADTVAEREAKSVATDTAPAERSPLLQTLRVSRPGLWATQLWFYLLPLGGYRVLDEWTFWLGAVYVTFPLGYLLYGWNDLADYETDHLNPRKGNLLFGARLSRAELDRLPRRIALVQAPFFVLFTVAIGPKFLLWIAASLAVNAAYNWPRIGFKGLPVLDVMNQAGYLLVFVLSSWVNDVPQLPWQAFLFGALFAMHSHLLNEITDVEPDRLAGRRTTAVVIGIANTKAVIAALLAIEAAIIAIWFDSPLVAGFLAAAAVGFAADFVWRSERVLSNTQLKWLLIVWNAVAIASMHWVWQQALFIR